MADLREGLPLFWPKIEEMTGGKKAAGQVNQDPTRRFVDPTIASH